LQENKKTRKQENKKTRKQEKFDVFIFCTGTKLQKDGWEIDALVLSQ
jgi:hypothetical protein